MDPEIQALMEKAGVISAPEVTFHTGGWAKFYRSEIGWHHCQRRLRGHASERQHPMPTVIGYHDVKDVEHWLASTRRAEAMATIGVTNIRTFVSPDNPNKVALLADVPDMDALMTAMQSPEFGEAMANDGVLLETVVFLVES